ncbi:MAG: excalibur calcium-binding domain-containing protein [Candidatus Competibacteraceae bacterium]
MPTSAKPTAPAAPSSDWICGTKTTCKQMGSCDEATFYLITCGVKRLNGDGDGVPCEKLCNC